MKYKLEEYIPDISAISSNMPKNYSLVASTTDIPGLGAVWYVNNNTISSILNGYQYAIKDKNAYIIADYYPQNAYLIISSHDSKLSVINSILLTYKDDRIIARRKSIGNTPVWELLDKEYIKMYKDIQNALFFENNFFAECYDKNTFLAKQTSLKRHITVNKEFKSTMQKVPPSISRIPIQKYSSLNAISLFHKYFTIDSSALNFIHIGGIEKYKMPNTNFNEVFAIGMILNSIEADGFALDKEVCIITMFEEQKHILADFYADRIGHEANRPKIGLPHEMDQKNFNVSIFSFTLSSKNDWYGAIETYEHFIRKIIDNSKDGAIFVGNIKILSQLHGFIKDLSGLIKALKKVSVLSTWSNPLTYADNLINLWKEPIKKMDPEKAANQAHKALLGKLYKNMEYELERRNVPSMTSIYKEYLRSLGINKVKKT